MVFVTVVSLIVSWLRPTKGPRDRQCQLLSCPGQLKREYKKLLLTFVTIDIWWLPQRYNIGVGEGGARGHWEQKKD